METLETQFLRYREWFDSAPDAHLVTNDDVVIREANRAAGALLNLEPQDLRGEALHRFIDPGSADALAEALVRVRESDQIAEWTLRLRPAGREPIDVSLTAAAARNPSGEIEAIHWMARDISQRLRAEEEIRRLNASLEQRVAQRTAELEVAHCAKDALLAREAALRSEAEAANKAKDQFMAVLSHELRTPLTPVLAAVSALAGDGRVPDDVRAILQTARRNIELEVRLIDDLLDLSRVGRGRLQLQVELVDIHESIENVAEMLAEDVRFKHLDLALELEAEAHHARADGARLRQVWWNLLSNAIKYTPSLGEITVRTRNEGESQILVDVSDSGVGIEPSTIRRLFAAFEKADRGESGQIGGLGLGLAISQALVGAHGGTISAASEGAYRGATFTVRLPAESASATDRAPEPEPVASRAAGGLRILLVEDHEDTARLMSRLLQNAGHRVKTATNVEKALHLSETEQFDLIISDLGLPDGTGLDLIQRLREHRTTRAIALSGFGMDEDIRRSKEAGFIEHLTKPVNFQRLLSAIEAASA